MDRKARVTIQRVLDRGVLAVGPSDFGGAPASHPGVEPSSDGGLVEMRAAQEREVALSHCFAEAEYALAREARAVGGAFATAGIPFDVVTFVVTRLLEGGNDTRVDPVELVRVMDELGVIDRSIALATELLDEAA